MSIPNSFSPMGTLRMMKELPYVQPIMTSATTWSNEPSFGMTVTGEGQVSGNEPWRIFAANGAWWADGWNGQAFLNFTQPLKITRIVLGCDEKLSTRTMYGDFFAEINGQWVKLGSYSYVLTSTAGGEDVIEISSPVYATRYRISLYCESGYGRMTYANLTAMYKQ